MEIQRNDQIREPVFHCSRYSNRCICMSSSVSFDHCKAQSNWNNGKTGRCRQRQQDSMKCQKWGLIGSVFTWNKKVTGGARSLSFYCFPFGQRFALIGKRRQKNSSDNYSCSYLKKKNPPAVSLNMLFSLSPLYLIYKRCGMRHKCGTCCAHWCTSRLARDTNGF